MIPPPRHLSDNLTLHACSAAASRRAESIIVGGSNSDAPVSPTPSSSFPRGEFDLTALKGNGVVVPATVRNGYWIVLDELNLAPSDVLEALNRLLNDNRELFVPELQETIKTHLNFMLFGTQNPPTHYGGRKMLSRAFRNRSIEIQVGEIPDFELARCSSIGSLLVLTFMQVLVRLGFEMEG
ncbi:hypothetical protein KIW84_030913 [Lathyrus oleraceus]|uniref:ATPase dynein-related AAA domain-containing protein n=1 Tax=Pisum sativum TaxID=3888 RepID=A0A9D4XPF8_PEA|nr:hypothetical protein KIW84_030913 [Pisum sativum]